MRARAQANPQPAEHEREQQRERERDREHARMIDTLCKVLAVVGLFIFIVTYGAVLPILLLHETHK